MSFTCHCFRFHSDGREIDMGTRTMLPDSKLVKLLLVAELGFNAKVLKNVMDDDGITIVVETMVLGTRDVTTFSSSGNGDDNGLLMAADIVKCYISETDYYPQASDSLHRMGALLRATHSRLKKILLTFLASKGIDIEPLLKQEDLVIPTLELLFENVSSDDINQLLED